MNYLTMMINRNSCKRYMNMCCLKGMLLFTITMWSRNCGVSLIKNNSILIRTYCWDWCFV